MAIFWPILAKFLKNIQAALVIRGLFICEFAYSHWNIDPKWQFYSQKWTFFCDFKIRGPKWRNISTANNEGNLYNISWYFIIYFIYSGKFSLKFFPFLKLLMAKIGLFDFSGPGNPAPHALNSKMNIAKIGFAVQIYLWTFMYNFCAILLTDIFRAK